MFDAFHNFAVANVQASKVDCLVVAGSDVYVGTADGHVILYSLSFRRGTSGDLVNIKGKELAKKTIGSTKKGVERLVHIRALCYLTALCDGVIYILDDQSLELKFALHQAKGANTFAVRDGASASDCRIVAARGKKVTFLSNKAEGSAALARAGFHLVEEHAVNDTVQSVTWTGAKVCVITKKECGLLDPKTGEFMTLLDADSRGNNGNYFIMTNDFGLVVDDTGVPVPMFSAFSWSETLMGFAASKPYMVGVHPGALGVYTIPKGQTTMTLVQRLALTGKGEGVCICSSPPDEETTEYVYVSNRSSGTLSCLVPAPLRVQVSRLVSQKRIEEAENLLRNCVTGTELEIGLMRLNRDAGLQSFAELDFNTAASYLRQAGPIVLHPGELVKLFPEVMEASGSRPQLFYDMGQVERLDGNPLAGFDDISDVVKHSGLEEGGLLLSDVEKEKVILSQAQDARTCVLRYLSDSHRKIQQMIDEVKESRGARGVGGDVRFWDSLLEEVDTWTAMLLADINSLDLEEFVQLPPATSVADVRARRVALVDTEQKSRKRMTISRDFRFSAPNYAKVEQVKEYLQKKEKYNALALLLRSRGDYIAALDIWQNLGTGKYIEVKKDGVSTTIETLRTEIPETIQGYELVFRYTAWILQVAPFEAVTVFTESFPGLDPDRVLQHIAKNAGDVTRSSLAKRGYSTKVLDEDYADNCESPMDVYLNCIVNKRGRTEERFHTAFAMRLTIHVLSAVDMLREEGEAFLPFEKPDESASTGLHILYGRRERLMRFLEKSNRYDVRVILRRLKGSPLREECVLLYRTAGRHDKALQIILTEMKDVSAAERYCLGRPWTAQSSAELNDPFDSEETTAPEESNYAEMMRKHEDQSNLFLLLLATLFSTELGGGKDEDVAMAESILRRHGSRIDPQGVLRIVSGSLPLGKIVDFLEVSFRSHTSRFRMGQVTKNLSQYDMVHTKHQLIGKRNTSVKINDSTTCPVCNKRIGDKVFATFPGGEVVHFKCFNHSTPYKSPVTNVDYQELFEKTR